MTGDPKPPGGPPADAKSPTCKPDQPHTGRDIYGGVWAAGGPREDTSGQGSAPRPPGEQPAAGQPAVGQPAADQPARKPEEAAAAGKGVYGGVWSSDAPREDKSGRGSAPRPPDAPNASEGKSFTGSDSPAADEEEPQVAADDAGASARTETPQRKPD